MSRFPPGGNGRLDGRRLALFVLFAFGIAWATAVLIYVTGGLRDSLDIVSLGTFSLSLAAVLLPTAYMFAPGIANLLTRLVTDEGWDALMLSFDVEHWRAYVTAWFAPGLVTALGTALFFLLFPRHFDPTAAAFASTVAGQGTVGVDPLVLGALTVGAAFLINPLFNTVFAFGEEFGWRGYLLPKLTPLGLRPAVVAHGGIWGAWHWPLIAMGYEYGFGYVGAPWTGMALFLLFTVAAGTFLAWLTLRTDSVWPASLGHGAINATAVVTVVFSRGDPNFLLGPVPIGLVGVVPWLALAGYLLVRMGDDISETASETRSTGSVGSVDE